MTRIVGNVIGQRLLVYISWVLPVHLTGFPNRKRRHKPNLELGTSFVVRIAVRSYELAVFARLTVTYVYLYLF